jgi:prophage antirepressor-like protein
MNLQIFKKDEMNMRVIEKDGELWFVAKDVADTLGYKDTEAMTRRLDDDEKTVLSLGNVQNLQIVGFENFTRGILIINESGLYNSILGSQKPNAKKFKKWVTSEVLPSIRKNGSYSLDNRNSFELGMDELRNVQVSMKEYGNKVIELLGNLEEVIEEHDSELDEKIELIERLFNEEKLKQYLLEIIEFKIAEIGTLEYIESVFYNVQSLKERVKDLERKVK